MNEAQPEAPAPPAEGPGRAQRVAQRILTALLLILLAINLWWFGFRQAPPAPDFSLPQMTAEGQPGEALALTDLKGKVVLLDFWATHCGPCKRTMPVLEKLHKDRAGENFVVLSVNIDSPDLEDRAERVSSYIQGAGYTFPVILDNGETWRRYEVKAIPTFFILTPDGRIAEKHRGTITEETLRRKIDAVLSRSGAS